MERKKYHKDYDYEDMSFLVQSHLPVNTWRVFLKNKKTPDTPVGIVQFINKQHSYYFTPEGNISLSAEALSLTAKFINNLNALDRADKQNKKLKESF